MTEKEKKKRGFAALTPEQRKEISSKGGKAAHSKGVAHCWTSQEAIEAGKLGGQATRRNKAESKTETEEN